MAYIKKYRKGDRITSLNELVKQEFVYLGNKIYHNGWFMSWSCRPALNYIERGRLYYAIKEEVLNGKPIEDR